VQVASSPSLYYLPQNPKAPDRELDKNAFFKILAAQLSHQDPMNPQDGSDFVAQLAQFSALEQMQNLNRTFEEFSQGQSFLQATGFINRKVTLDDGNGGTVTGVVEKVRLNGAAVELMVNGAFYNVGRVVQVE